MNPTDPLATCPSCKRCREWCGCEPEEEEYPVATFYEPVKWWWSEGTFIVNQWLRKMSEPLGGSGDG